MPSVYLLLLAIVTLLFLPCGSFAQESQNVDESLYIVGYLEPIDSELAVHEGDPLPPFDLETIEGERIRLEDFLGKKNIVLSFVPAAWTPVCSGQWPGYNIVQDIFEAHDAVLIGISVDSIPTLHAWVNHMGGLWFPVASDFWPHGAYAEKLGILRSEGVSERALFLADKQGIIRYIDVHDINSRPDLGELVKSLATLN